MHITTAYPFIISYLKKKQKKKNLILSEIACRILRLFGVFVFITDSSQYKLISFFTGQFLNDLTKSPDQLHEDIMLSFNHLKSPCHWKEK